MLGERYNPVLKDYEVKGNYDCDNYSFLMVTDKDGKDSSLIIPNPSDTSQDRIARLYKNYKLSRQISHHNILEYNLVNDDIDFPLAITEAFTGIPLSYLTKDYEFNPIEICDIILDVIEGLLALHQQDLIHLRINPDTILYSLKTKEVKLFCFDDTTHLSEVNRRTLSQTASSNYVKYISPETTGKTNYLEDQRSDLYSLGLVLYYLLTKANPFQERSLPKLIYQILTQEPIVSKIIRKNTSNYLSDISEKLIKKSPLKRYQTIIALKHDLTYIRNNLKNNVPENKFEFYPAQYDLLRDFNQSNIQIGREKEHQRMLDLHKTASEGNKVILLVEGLAGIGKSLLVSEFLDELKAGQHAIIKLDQFKQEIQFNLLLDGFKKVLLNLLQTDENIFNRWKLRFLNKLGSTASILQPFIPEINHFITIVQDLPELEGQEALNRFKVVMNQFIEVLSNEASPFILVIEDIHWINNEMIEFLNSIFENIDLNHFMIILNYRPEDIVQIEYRHEFLKRIKQISTNTITLHPLDQNNIENLLVKIIDQNDPNKVDFIELIHTKTLGNPLGVKRFLKTLEIMKLISFEGESLKWVWQTRVLKSVLDYSDYNVIISHSLGEEADTLIQILNQSSCIGNSFQISILKALVDELIDDPSPMIQESINLGIISKTSVAGDMEQYYKFTHDSIHEYFYNKIELEEKLNVHLKIGRIFTQRGTIDIENNLFFVIDQYNRAKDIIKSYDEKIYVSSLNLRAGTHLLRSLAYRSSLNYFLNGISILKTLKLEEKGTILVNLYLRGAEAAYLSFESETLDSLSNEIKSVTNDPVLQAYAVSLQIRLKFSQLQFAETIKIGFQALFDFNVEINFDKNLNDIIAEYQALKSRLIEIGLDKIDKIAQIENKVIIAEIHLLESLLEVLYTFKPELYPVFVFKILEITLEYGSHLFLGNCVANMALLAGGLFNDIDFANELCLVAIKTEKTSRDKFIIYFGSYTWKHHYRTVLIPLKGLIDSYVETGEFSYSGFASFQYCYVMLQIGYNLRFISDMTAEFQRVFIKTNDTYNLSMNSILHANLLALQGEPNTFDQFEDQLLNIGNNNLLCHFYNLKLFLMYIHGDLENIIEVGQHALKYSMAVIGSVEFIAIYYFNALAILLIQRKLKIQNDEMDVLIQEIFGKFEVWAKIYPINFEHKFLLMQAEKRNCDSDFKTVAILYENAIAMAKQNKYILDEALSYELAGRFYLDENFNDIAITYIQKSLRIYHQIGINVKVKKLEDEFELMRSIGTTESNQLTTYDNRDYSHLDFTSLINTLLTLSSETDYDKLINSMMGIIVEHSGAENCLLLIKPQNEIDQSELQKDEWLFQAQFNKNDNMMEIYESENLIDLNDKNLIQKLPTSIFNYSIRTGQSLIVQDSLKDERFFDDPYLMTNQIKTFIALPLKSQDKIKGFLFLGNSKMEGVFTASQMEFVKVLSFQFLISIENSNLYKRLRLKIKTVDEKIHLARKFADEELVKLSILKDEEYTKTSSAIEHKSTQHIDRFIDYMNYLSKMLEPSELEEFGIK